MIDPYIEACELRRLTVTRQVRPREVAEFFLDRIERLNPRLGAFMTVTAERALDDAGRLEQADATQAASMPLYGVAYSLKDLTWTKGIRTTMGSRNFAEFVPEVDAEIAVRLQRAGGILLGKTTTPEFGGRPTTEGGLCPAARNPWNLAHTAGGSSGGAASALASGLGPIAEGSDGGGSIRIPSACCGVVGLKPARGRVSFAPMMGEVWAGFATSGPMARSVRDAALMLDVIAGPPVGEPYWAPPPAQPFSAAVDVRPRDLRLASLAETSLAVVDPETLAAFDSACDAFRTMGHSVEPIKIDPARLLLESTITIMCAGLASLPVPDPTLMDPVVREFRDYGLKISAAEYLGAVMRMHNQSREIVQSLVAYDALLTPTLTRPAVPLGTLPSASGRYMEELWSWLPFTFPFNATGQPAFSVPNGFTKAGLPIGLQIVGRPADEATIISIAAAFEEARPWRAQHPPVD
ncbi:MAG: amidase [Candidatus Binataceae bacterium]|jgi:Asp-tRNA(Asn)/Glu-tRNA(Gln) amidotransferase A subunit family amidase